MKTKILVAMVACLAIAACSKQEASKDEHKAGESTQGTGGATKSEPAHPGTAPAGHSSANEAATTIAADDTAANAAATTPATTATDAAHDADKKVGDMKQDMNNTANQMQGNTTSGDAAKATTDTHTHED